LSLLSARPYSGELLSLVEAVNDYAGHVSDMTMIIELKDGRIWPDRRYYAESFEAPEWRARWVERAEFQGSCSPELLRAPSLVHLQTRW